MSNYMFMLENHLNTAQKRALSAVQDAAAASNLKLFLGGGSMRDMLGGLPIRELEFIVEGSALKLARGMEHAGAATVLAADELRRDVELLFPGGIKARVATATQERYPKPGGKPHITPAGIHEHLQTRDLTVNAIALSLSRASRGLLLDPTNGLADLDRRELRAISNYTFYDQPIALFRIIRLKVRLNFQIAERTRVQYDNARSAGVVGTITPEALLGELRRAASEPNPGETLQAWDHEGLLAHVSPALAGGKLNVAGFQKLHKSRQLVPYGTEVPVDDEALFFHVLTEKLSPKERSEFEAALGLSKTEVEHWHKLESRAKKLEKELSSAQLQKASLVYRVLSKSPAELPIYLLMKSGQRVVHDRIRNYFQKYLPAAMEVTDEQVAQSGAVPGTPKFEKLKADLISKKLDSRPKRPPEPAVSTAPPTPAPRPRFTSTV